MNLKESLTEKLSNFPTSLVVSPNGSLYNLEVASGDADFKELKRLYTNAFARGDLIWFKNENDYRKFEEDLESRVGDQKKSWILLKDKEKNIAGATLVSEKGTNFAVDDFTQMNPDYRGQGLMPKLFFKLLPLIRKLGYNLEGESVLSSSGSSLRKTWMMNGATCIGIKPNIYQAKNEGVSNLITPIYASYVATPDARLIPQFMELYNIVARQLGFGKAKTVFLRLNNSVFGNNGEYEELLVNGEDPLNQGLVFERGFRPVWYDPFNNVFGVAKFPGELKLDFLLNEGIEPAAELVKYLKNLN